MRPSSEADLVLSINLFFLIKFVDVSYHFTNQSNHSALYHEPLCSLPGRFSLSRLRCHFVSEPPEKSFVSGQVPMDTLTPRVKRLSASRDI